MDNNELRFIPAVRGCTLHELRVLLSLLTRADAGGFASPTNGQIAAEWGMTDRHVRAAMRKLETPTGGQPPLVVTVAAGGGSRGPSKRRVPLAIGGDHA